jgi:PAS domain S-box-containing protein
MEKKLPTDLTILRHQAKKHLVKLDADISYANLEPDEQILIQELQIHQIELEMQNDALQQARNELEHRVSEQTAELQESESHYRELFEAGSDAIILIDDTTGNILDANIAALVMYGYERDELLTKKDTDLSTESEETEQVVLRTPISEDEIVTIPLSFQRKKDGTVFPIEIKGRFFVRKGRPVHLESIRDITERRQSEDALKRSQKMLARTESIAHIGSWEWDVASDTVTWSDEMFCCLQLDPTNGAPSFAAHDTIFHHDDMVKLTHAVETAVSTGKPYEMELRAILADGKNHVYIARGYAEVDPEGNVTHLYGLLQDITESKQAD